MNILIPHNWLLEHLETKATPPQIQKYLSLCGPSVEKIEKVKGEAVYDIEVTTNRVDSMSVRGIAREAATILPEFGIKTKLLPLELIKLHSTKELDFTIINDPKLCKRVITLKLENIKLKPSPHWLQKRLRQVGQRPLNNAIDITNYIMWEIGHPIHVFDYDKLTRKKIVIRQGKAGESLVTLDDKKHVLKGGEVIFDDGTGEIIDVPGIMGTKNTVVSEKTSSVLLLIESINADKIRFASMTHAIRSQAAVLNEKHVDPELAQTAILRAIDLYKKICSTTIGSQLYDDYPQKPQAKTITLSQKLLNTYMGTYVEPRRVKRILVSLGCQVNINKDPSSYQITPPSWRVRDMRIPQDAIEEIARIYGYHNLPSIVMASTIPDNPPEEDFKLENKIKNLLTGWGIQEVYTYSMVSKDLAEKSGHKLSSHLKIKNPLTDEMEYMRRSLIPSLIKAINDNQRDKISLFEMQNVYHPRKKTELPNEELQLVITTTQKYAFLKGILDALAAKLFITNLRVEPMTTTDEPFQEHSRGNIVVNGVKLGNLGIVKNSNIFALKLRMNKIQKLAHTHPRFIPVHHKPPIIEDLTFSLPKKTYLGHVMEDIRLTNKLIEKVSLSKVYKPKSQNQTNYTFTIQYRHPKKSLKDIEINPIRRKIVKNLESHFKATLVGKLL